MFLDRKLIFLSKFDRNKMSAKFNSFKSERNASIYQILFDCRLHRVATQFTGKMGLKPRRLRAALCVRIYIPPNQRIPFACPKPASTQQSLVSSSSYSPLSPRTLKNSAWQLTRWEYQGSPVVLLPQTEVSLQFKNNQVNGSSGCNRFSGSCKLVKEKISLGSLESTQRGCEAPIMNQESQFLSALQLVKRIAADTSGNLVVFYALGDKEGVLHFVPKK